MTHWTNVLLEQLELQLTEGEGRESIHRWSDLNLSFHKRRYQACARPRLLNLITSLNAKCRKLYPTAGQAL